jgi:hypothetical protein
VCLVCETYQRCGRQECGHLVRLARLAQPTKALSHRLGRKSKGTLSRNTTDSFQKTSGTTCMCAHRSVLQGHEWQHNLATARGAALQLAVAVMLQDILACIEQMRGARPRHERSRHCLERFRRLQLVAVHACERVGATRHLNLK